MNNWILKLVSLLKHFTLPPFPNKNVIKRYTWILFLRQQRSLHTSKGFCLAIRLDWELIAWLYIWYYFFFIQHKVSTTFILPTHTNNVTKFLNLYSIHHMISSEIMITISRFFASTDRQHLTIVFDLHVSLVLIQVSRLVPNVTYQDGDCWMKYTQKDQL